MDKTKRRIKRYLVRRFFIRFHMSIILIATILVGLISTKLLFVFNVEDIRIRYPLIVIISYLAFFLFIRIWLFYIKYRNKIIDNTLNIFDIPTDSLSNTSDSTMENVIESGGGKFGGGGATGSFDMPGGDIVQEGSSAIADAAGESVSSILEEGAIVLVPLMIILVIIFGAGALLIYEAPVILTEVAFEFLLAGTLVKKAKEIDNPDWIGSVFKKTWIPFTFTLTITIAFAFALNYLFPEIKTLSGIIK